MCIRDRCYSSAWLHHKGRNKHHLEYWIDYTTNKSGLGGMKMPPVSYTHLKLKYRRSVLGVLWSVLNPLLMCLVYWAVFSSLMDMRGSGIDNFPVFLMLSLIHIWCRHR